MSIKSISKLCQGTLDGRSKELITLDYLQSLAVNQDDSIHKRLLEELIRGYVLLEKKSGQPLEEHPSRFLIGRLRSLSGVGIDGIL